MKTPQTSPKKGSLSSNSKSSQATLSFKQTAVPDHNNHDHDRLKTPPPPITQPISPPDTPQQPQKSSFNPNDRKYTQEYSRILKTNHIATPLFGLKTSAAEKILLNFDMCYKYGPTVGIPRLVRWQRAYTMGLNPPTIVEDILFTAVGTQFSEPYSYGRH